MLISLRSHKLIVDCLEKRIAELEAERDFYRSQWTAKQGAPFTSVVVENDSTRPSAVQEAPIDANWSADDRELFDMWRLSNVGAGEDALEVWRRKHGTQAPLMALTV
jgi:hypothetical protein